MESGESVRCKEMQGPSARGRQQGVVGRTVTLGITYTPALPISESRSDPCLKECALKSDIMVSSELSIGSNSDEQFGISFTDNFRAVEE